MGSASGTTEGERISFATAGPAGFLVCAECEGKAIKLPDGSICRSGAAARRSPPAASLLVVERDHVRGGAVPGHAPGFELSRQRRDRGPLPGGRGPLKGARERRFDDVTSRAGRGLRLVHGLVHTPHFRGVV